MSGPTGRQLECLAAYLRLDSHKEAAAQLGISPHTSKNHVYEAVRALDARGPGDAAIKLGWLRLPESFDQAPVDRSRRATRRRSLRARLAAMLAAPAGDVSWFLQDWEDAKPGVRGFGIHPTQGHDRTAVIEDALTGDTGPDLRATPSGDRLALDRIASLTLDMPPAYGDGESWYRNRAQEAIGIAARALRSVSADSTTERDGG